LVVSAVPIAIVTNALRVSGTGVLAHYYGTGIADGFFHSFSGWAMYLSAALLMFGVSWLFDRFGSSATDGGRIPPAADTHMPMASVVASLVKSAPAEEME